MTKRILCFGELLLRLSAPGRETLLQTPELRVHYGGAEANVAVSLARLGHHALMTGTVADNALGAAALGELRRHGVDPGGVRTAPGRMGLYFLSPGAGVRPSEVLYDRAGSAFAQADPASYDWPRLLEGCDLMHLSGITPALGPRVAAAARAAVEAAIAAGVPVSFDGNFRPMLWAAWEGDPRAILHRLLAGTETAFADHRDIAVILGPADTNPAVSREQHIAAAAARAFEAFPRLQRIASTLRTQHSVDHHALGAVMITRSGRVVREPDRDLDGIIDRIGTGDAFAAGVLHGLLTGMDEAASLGFGLAAACLKHSIPGDANPVDGNDIAACARREGPDVRR